MKPVPNEIKNDRTERKMSDAKKTKMLNKKAMPLAKRTV